MNRRKIKIPILLFVIFLITIILINPKGNFPLNDDWVYAHPIKSLLDNNQLHFYEWTGPILIFQVFYGFVVSKITGLSFNFLRLSTLLFSFLSVIIFYLLSIKVKKNKLLILLSLATLFFNPIFLNTSLTFLTDIPFLFFYLSAIYFFIKSIENKKYFYLTFSLLLGLASFFIRQNGILFFVAIILIYLYYLFKKDRENITFLKKTLPFTGISVLICFCGYLIFQNYIDISGAQTHLLETAYIVKHGLTWLFYSIQYLGLFILPISILCLFKKDFYKKIDKIIFLSILIILLFVTFYFNLFFPYDQNIINDYGLGPNTQVLQGLPALVFTKTLKIIISVLACFGGAILITTLKNIIKKIKNNLFLNFVFINFILQLILILFFKGFDRYFLLVLPMILILFLSGIKTNKKVYIVSIILLLIFSFFSITLNKNYLDWNRARNSLYQQISQTKFYYQIEGGYELNGWYTYDIMQNAPVVVDLTKPWYLHRLFSPNTNEFVISFSILPNHKILDSRKYYNYFLFKKEIIYLLQKNYD